MLMQQRPRAPMRVGINLLTEGPGRNRMRAAGLRRAVEFTWGATAAFTPDVYREAAERRRRRRL